MNATHTPATSTIVRPILGKYYVGGMAESDLDSVAYIERTSQETFWDKEDFRRILKEPGMQGRVIRSLGLTVGHCLFQLLDDETQVWNLTLYPDYRRKRIGSTILSNLLRDYACVPLTCYVRDTNLCAHKFMRANGALASHVKQGYCVDYDVHGRATYTDAYHFTLQSSMAMPGTKIGSH